MGEIWHTAKYAVLTGLYLAKPLLTGREITTRGFPREVCDKVQIPIQVVWERHNHVLGKSERRCITEARAQE